MIASVRGYHNIVQLLLDKGGANIETRNKVFNNDNE